MAEYKKNIIVLSTGKQIKLFGTCIGISKSLEIAEAYAPNLLSNSNDLVNVGTGNEVSNPKNLSVEEIQEIADFNIRLWLDLKDRVRKFGITSKKIFNKEN